MKPDSRHTLLTFLEPLQRFFQYTTLQRRRLEWRKQWTGHFIPASGILEFTGIACRALKHQFSQITSRPQDPRDRLEVVVPNPVLLARNVEDLKSFGTFRTSFKAALYTLGLPNLRVSMLNICRGATKQISRKFSRF